ncbi:unnamed protein product [Ostreobium quekettii]|uniref:Uncharacterized protein n=1 Tax=Ostreobium quekettii TaxID=121088 RepID=A0A8S1J262_9CHLO|nr:unnamed protein product [Ostreobium quekettii]|eukprot:evm.model.scf_143.6 EVM.evm.TU.scf_143.6   scf_143:104999-121596(+)
MDPGGRPAGGSELMPIPPAIKIRSLPADEDLGSDYGVSPSTPLLSTAIDENGWVCGSNAVGQLGVGGQENVWELQPVQGVRRWAAISFGDYHSAGISCDGELYTWGLSSKGQLGHRDEEARELPEKVSDLEGTEIRNVTCGSEHTVAVSSQEVYSWGSNEHGQLGQGDLAPDCVRKPRVVKALHGKMVMQVVCGKFHTLAVTAQSHVYGWGQNSQGQLGLGDRVERHTPTHVDALWALPVKQLAAGDWHSMALTNSGFLFTWGCNQQGQLGLPPDAEHAALQSQSRTREGRRRMQKRVNQKFLTAMLEMGIQKEKAELALAETKNVGVEMAAEWLYSAPEGVIERHLEEERHGSSMEERNPDVTDDKCVMVPKRVPLKCVRCIGAGGNHTIAVTSQAVFSWGAGEHGELGIGAFCNKELPLKVVALDGREVEMVACGSQHTLFLSQDGSVFGCGSNDFGQLGYSGNNGTDVAYVSLPAKLKLPFNKGQQQRRGSRRKEPLVGTISAGGHASGFLTQVHEDMPGVPSVDLWARIQDNIEAVRLGNRDDTHECTSNMRALVSSIEMVFGSAAALSATFGYKDRVGLDVYMLRDVQNKILALCDKKHVSDPSQGQLKSIADLCSVSIVQAMSKAATQLIEDLYVHVKLLGTPERTQVLLAAAQHPLLVEQPFAKSLLPRLCSTILNSPSAARHLLVKWWGEYPGELLEEAVVKPLQCYVTKELMATKKLTVSVMNAIKVLSKVEESNDIGRKLPPEAFYNQLISEKMDVLDHYIAWRQSHDHPQRRPGQDGPFSFCSYPFLLDARAKSKLLHMEAKLQMEQTIAQSRMESVYGPFNRKNRKEPDDGRILPDRKVALKRDEAESSRRRKAGAGEAGKKARNREGPGIRSLFVNMLTRAHHDGGREAGEADEVEPRLIGREGTSDGSLRRAGSLQLPRPENSGIPATHSDMCILRIRRNHLTEDALDEIARQHRKDLFKPLRVHFIGEEGIDAGGVKKEFFQILVEKLLSVDYGMLAYQPESRTYWFNPVSLEHEDEFLLIGLVVGLAVYNGVLLDFPLPMALYKKLIGMDVGLRELEEMQPTVGKSLRQLLQYEGPGSVADVFYQSFSIDVNMFGDVKTIPLRPDGEDELVTEENRREYIDLYVDYVLNRAACNHFEAFSKGFRTICGGPAIHLFNAAELERLVCGNPFLDFDALEKNARYEGGFKVDSPAVRWLWELANDFSKDEKKLFLKFFTGSDRAPIGGLGNLKCIIQRDGTDSRKLPTSHTCFNTLLLPDYGSKSLMRDRLRLAIMNAEGFGLE